MKWSIERKMMAGVLIALVFLLANAFVSYRATRKLIEHEHLVSHTHQVLTELEAALSTMKDAETGERGYIITGEESYLEPYQSAITEINDHVEKLNHLTADNPTHQVRIPVLKRKVADRLDSLRKGIDLKRNGGAEGPRQNILSGVGKKLMDDLRQYVGELESDENKLLMQRSEDARQSGRQAILTFFIANLSACALLLSISFVIKRDFAARKRAQEALRQQREWLRVTLSSIGDGVIATDMGGSVTFLNHVAQSLTGWKPEEAERQPLEKIFNIVNEETRKAVENPALRAMREGIIVGLANDTVLITKDGARIAIDDSGAPIKDSEGNTLGSVVIFRDISERRRGEEERAQLLAREKAAREQAEAASRAKDEFVATISHEIRSPLNAILGWAQMLSTGRFNQAETTRAIKTIERNARAQTQLIEDLLDISRVITGKLTLDVRPVDLTQIIQAAMESIRPAADAKSVQLCIQVDRSGSLVSGDANRLQQIVWNLLSNAVKFTSKGGRIDVSVERINSHLRITISDSGAGISPEFLPYVFDRFSQANTSSQWKHGGLGLGLAIVRHLVELHGGTVRADSPGEGQGATFTITFPVRVVREADAVERRDLTAGLVGSVADTTTLGGLRVMIVDDEAETRDLLAAILSQYGADVTACASTSEALETVQQWRPGVLVSDIGMPDEDGYELIRKLRALDPDRGGTTPAVALTAYARSEDRTRALAAGFQMHVIKPVEALELIMVIASLAGRTARSTAD